jgi:Tol biopolymer transport system component
MARISWCRSVLSTLPIASLLAAGLPAEHVPIAVADVHKGQVRTGKVHNGPVHSGRSPGLPGTEARFPARTSSMSAGGNIVAFSENIGASSGVSPLYVVFARDLTHGVTRRISRGVFAGVAAPGNGVHPYSTVSGDGRYVAFAQYTDVPRFDVLVYEMSSQTTRQISVGRNGAAPDGHSFNPAINGDGSAVAFESAATNLVAGDTNDDSDIFVGTGGTIRRASLTTNGQQANGNSHLPTISADGRYVIFVSDASNLVPGDTNDSTDVFVRDLQYGITNRVSLSSAGGQANGSSFDVAISADGRYVAFDSAASNLVAGDTNDRTDVFVRDLRYGITNRVSLSSSGAQGDGFSSSPALSADGRYAAFTSAATNLVTGDTNLRTDVFVRDIRFGATYRVSLGAGDTQGDGYSTAASISADGQFVAFTSAAGNLVPLDANGVEDGFVRDRWNRTTVRATVDTDPF